MGALGIGEKKARKLTRTCGGTDFMLAIPSNGCAPGRSCTLYPQDTQALYIIPIDTIFQYRLRPCELLHLDIVSLGSIALTSLFSLFYVTREDRQETEETALFKP